MDPVIDISHWQDEIDFAAVKASGVIGVIHKCTEGDDYLDPTFEERRDKYAARRQSARTIGLLWGAYHFLRPGDMVEQANWFVRNVDDDAPTLLAADHEDPGVSLDDLKLFLETVRTLTGQRPCVYSGHVIKEQLGGAGDVFLSRHRLWLAHYSSEPSWPDHTWSTYWLWQYTDTGSCPGVTGNCDLNRFVGDDTDQLVEEWLGYDE
jgi:lysozyme